MKKILIFLTIVLPVTGKTQWNIIYTHSDIESAMHVLNKDTIFSVTGEGGRIFKSTDGGNAWSLYQTVFTTSWFLDVHFPNPLTGYACGGSAFGEHKEVIAKTIDGGQTWDSLTSDAFGGYSFTRIHFINSDTGFVAGQFNGLLRTFDGGTSFSPVGFPNDGVAREILFQSPVNGFVTASKYIAPDTYVYSILNTGDLGNTWTEVYLDTMSAVTGMDHRTVNTLFFVNSLVGFAVGGNGLFLKTINGGLTWAAQLISPNNNLTGLHFIDENVGYINNAGGIQKTTNGGNTWAAQTIFPLTIIHQISFASDTLGFALGDYGIYKTVNGGGSIGISETDGNLLGSVYPNPTNGIVNFDFNETVKLSLFDASGNNVLLLKINSHQTVDMSQLPNGIYLARVVAGNKTGSVKIILSR